MRGVLHDFPDDKCRLILKHTIDALGKDSVILIDDMVLPDKGVFWQTAQVDLTMMSSLAAKERTHEQWIALLDSVGLKILDIFVYTPAVHESVIKCVPK
jgi:demethylsterigmatocystin 6-O-methyltransferase